MLEGYRELLFWQHSKDGEEGIRRGRATGRGMREQALLVLGGHRLLLLGAGKKKVGTGGE